MGTGHNFRQIYIRYAINSGRNGETYIDLRITLTGFMLIKRAAFTRMIAAFPELRFAPDLTGSIPQHFTIDSSMT